MWLDLRLFPIGVVNPDAAAAAAAAAIAATRECGGGGIALVGVR